MGLGGLGAGRKLNAVPVLCHKGGNAVALVIASEKNHVQRVKWTLPNAGTVPEPFLKAFVCYTGHTAAVP